MRFDELRVDNIKTIIHYKPDVLSWRAENRRDHIIGINVSGSAKHDLGYKHLDLYPDYIYFFNQKDDFDAVTTEVGYCYSIHFTTYEPIDTESFCKKVSNTEEIVKRIKRIEDEWLRSERGQLSMMSDFYSLCNVIYNAYNAPYTPRDERVMAAKEYMDLYFKEKNCLGIAVELCRITGRRFNDVFKLHYGITPNQYIIAKKIDYAKQLLSVGYLSIVEVSELAGFSDVYYFSKLFKRETGMPPGNYKKSVKKG